MQRFLEIYHGLLSHLSLMYTSPFSLQHHATENALVNTINPGNQCEISQRTTGRLGVVPYTKYTYTKAFLIGCISMEWYKYVLLTMYTTYFPCSGVR